MWWHAVGTVVGIEVHPLCLRRRPVRRWPVTRRGRERLATDLSPSATRRPPRREFEHLFEHHECTPGSPLAVNHDAAPERDNGELPGRPSSRPVLGTRPAGLSDAPYSPPERTSSPNWAASSGARSSSWS